jgi:hypothetical protein
MVSAALWSRVAFGFWSVTRDLIEEHEKCERSYLSSEGTM